MSRRIVLLTLASLLGLGLAGLFQSRASQADTVAFLNHYPDPVPGGIALIQIRTGDPRTPDLRYQGKRVLVLRNGEEWSAVVGLPLDTKPGMQQLLDTVSGARYNFEVMPKEYEAQYITLENKRQVNPKPEDLRRIERDTQQINRALSQSWHEQLQPSLPLSLPLAGRFSSPFGLRRYFNQQPRKPHSGLDIAAAQGTPVVAPLQGRVVATGDYFFNGNTVFLDHGQGFLSMYCHLDQILVTPGQLLQSGQELGRVGSTGRATGPHLHWGTRLNGVWVDPHLLLAN